MIEKLSSNKRVFIPVLIVLFTIFGIWLRYQPSSLLLEGFPKVLFTDPWYALKQTELTLTHFPSQIWFDPMTNFPQGKPIDWGPFLPWIGSLLCRATGLTTPETMIPLVSWIPVVCFVLTIPVGYFLGRTIYDQKTGVITVLILTVLPGNFLIRTLYGNYDHHCLEILISAAFALLYILALRSSYQQERHKTIAFSIVAGLFLAAGVLNSVIILLLVIVCLIFTIIHMFITFATKTEENNIIITNILVFGVSLIGPIILVLLGLPGGEGYVMSPLELAEFLVIVPLISIGLWIIGALSQKISQNQKTSLGIYFIFLAIGVIGPFVLLPTLFYRTVDLFTNFFFFPNEYIPVGEMQAWDLVNAFQTYNLLLILFACGIIVLIYHWLKEREVSAGYVSVWALVCLAATITHVRYEYYLAVPFVLVSSLVISKIFNFGQVMPHIEEEEKQQPVNKNSAGVLIGSFMLCAILLMFGIFSFMIASTDYSPYTASEDMIEGMMWLNTHSTDPGINYTNIYQPQKPFPYSPEAYGLLSWWESGHVMNFFSHRPVIADPFQSHAQEAAEFFLSPNESAAEKQATDTKARYVITDSSMLFDNLAVMLQTYNSNQTVNDYFGYVAVTDSVNNTSHNDIGFKEPFYRSMITRLHVFDGSATKGEKPVVGNDTGTAIPGTDMIAYFPWAGPDPIVSPEINVPLESTEALQHYQLVWESNTSVSATPKHDIRKVKIFERVKGAVIPGEGTIELNLVTNEGREFTYRQQSDNGTFIVPYSTEPREGFVHATGPYRISESGKEIEIWERDISEV